MSYVRDLRGYGGAATPLARWGDGSAVALNVLLHLEEGAERSPRYGDSTMEEDNEAYYRVPPGAREIVAESFYDYGGTAGLRQLRSLISSYRFPLTVSVAGRALQAHPATAEWLAACEHEVAGQGMRFAAPSSGSDLRSDIAETIAMIQGATGKTVRGWYCRPPVPEWIHDEVARAAFSYDSCSVADDVPYHVGTETGPLLVLPCSLEGDDLGYWRNRYRVGSDFADAAIAALRELTAEARRHQAARMFTIQLRPRISGRPGRLAGLRAVFDYVSASPAISCRRRIDIAENWTAAVAPGTG
jgi:allantoinase